MSEEFNDETMSDIPPVSEEISEPTTDVEDMSEISDIEEDISANQNDNDDFESQDLEEDVADNQEVVESTESGTIEQDDLQEDFSFGNDEKTDLQNEIADSDELEEDSSLVNKDIDENSPEANGTLPLEYFDENGRLKDITDEEYDALSDVDKATYNLEYANRDAMDYEQRKQEEGYDNLIEENQLRDSLESAKNDYEDVIQNGGVKPSNDEFDRELVKGLSVAGAKALGKGLDLDPVTSGEFSRLAGEFGEHYGADALKTMAEVGYEQQGSRIPNPQKINAIDENGNEHTELLENYNPSEKLKDEKGNFIDIQFFAEKNNGTQSKIQEFLNSVDNKKPQYVSDVYADPMDAILHDDIPIDEKDIIDKPNYINGALSDEEVRAKYGEFVRTSSLEDDPEYPQNPFANARIYNPNTGERWDPCGSRLNAEKTEDVFVARFRDKAGNIYSYEKGEKSVYEQVNEDQNLYRYNKQQGKIKSI